MRPKRAAFTLTELLVVMAVIGTLVAVSFGLFRGSDPSVALRSGQATLNSLFTGARAQAALAGRPARIFFYAAAPRSGVAQLTQQELGFMRSAFVAVQDRENPANWIRVGDDTRLPDGVAFVPWNTTTVESMTAEDPTTSARIPWKRTSSVSNATLVNAAVSKFDGTSPASAVVNGATVTNLLWIGLLPTGRLEGNQQVKVILSPAAWGATNSPPGPSYTNPQMQMGVKISVYGVPVLIGDAYGFGS